MKVLGAEHRLPDSRRSLWELFDIEPTFVEAPAQASHRSEAEVGLTSVPTPRPKPVSLRSTLVEAEVGQLSNIADTERTDSQLLPCPTLVSLGS